MDITAGISFGAYAQILVEFARSITGAAVRFPALVPALVFVSVLYSIVREDATCGHLSAGVQVEACRMHDHGSWFTGAATLAIWCCAHPMGCSRCIYQEFISRGGRDHREGIMQHTQQCSICAEGGCSLGMYPFSSLVHSRPRSIVCCMHCGFGRMSKPGSVIHGAHSRTRSTCHRVSY